MVPPAISSFPAKMAGNFKKSISAGNKEHACRNKSYESKAKLANNQRNCMYSLIFLLEYERPFLIILKYHLLLIIQKPPWCSG